MRRIVTAITAAALSLSLVSMAMPANAAAGFDSAYAGESAFLTLNAGQSGTFTVFFANTGTSSWTKGTATQVDLAACKEDKTTCDAQDTSEAPFNSGWLSATRYATHTQTTVAPGSIGTFTYNVMVAAGQAAGTYRFNGALVVSATSADVHNEGYFQDVTVPAAPAASCTPTGITASPTFSQTQVGSTYTQTVTVDCDPPTGSTTRPKASGAAITFIVDAASTDTGNADLTLTATTDANGVASVSWTRSNPGTDTVSAYPTSTPTVRATTTVKWTVAATGAVITCTPTESASAVNLTTRTYTVTVKNPTTGAAASSLVVDVKFSAATAGTVITTPTGSSAPSNTSGSSQEGTTDSAGVLAFTVTGENTTATPIAFVDNDTTATWGGDNNNNKAATEFSATCGATTFAVQKAVIAVTPDPAQAVLNGGDAVYTVSATNTIGGGAFTSALRVSFTQLTDSDLGTTTTCTIAWKSTGSTPATTPGTAGTGGRTAPISTTNESVTPNTSGGFTFGVTGTGTSCTPVVWQDVNTDTALQTEEPQDTAGKVTFSAAGGGIASASLTSSATQPTSSGEATPANDGSSGEKTFTFTLKDGQGNTQTAPTGGVTVNFTVTNTGTRAVYITAINGSTPGGGVITVAAGASVTISASIAGGASTASIELDSISAQTDTGNKNWASASVKGELASNTAINKTSTITWVAADPEPTTQAQGTVLAVDTTANFYVLDTPAGVFKITYAGSETFIVISTTVNEATFESNISATDVVKFNGLTTHEITTNN